MFSGTGMPSSWSVSVVRPGSTPRLAKPPHSALRHSGGPGTRGSPWKVLSVRQPETVGTGCEIGPGNQRSTMSTGRLASGTAPAARRRRLVPLGPSRRPRTPRAPRSPPRAPSAPPGRTGRGSTGGRSLGSCHWLRSGSCPPTRALAEDRHRPGLAVEHPLERPEVVGGDQVVVLEALGMERVVDEVRERLRVGRVRDVVEAHDDQVVVAVALREAGGRAVVGGLRAGHRAVDVGKPPDRAADPDGPQVVRSLLDRGGQPLRVVLVGAEVEDVLERPHAPRRARVVGRGVVVRGDHREGLARDADVLRLDELRGAAPEEVLRQVEVLLDDRDPLAVRPLDDQGAGAQPRLQAVGRRTAGRVAVRVELLVVGASAVRGVLPGRGTDVPGGVDVADAGLQLAPRRRPAAPGRRPGPG